MLEQPQPQPAAADSLPRPSRMGFKVWGFFSSSPFLPPVHESRGGSSLFPVLPLPHIFLFAIFLPLPKPPRFPRAAQLQDNWVRRRTETALSVRERPEKDHMYKLSPGTSSRQGCWPWVPGCMSHTHTRITPQRVKSANRHITSHLSLPLALFP